MVQLDLLEVVCEERHAFHVPGSIRWGWQDMVDFYERDYWKTVERELERGLL